MRLMANASIFHINKDIPWCSWITRAKEREKERDEERSSCIFDCKWIPNSGEFGLLLVVNDEIEISQWQRLGLAGLQSFSLISLWLDHTFQWANMRMHEINVRDVSSERYEWQPMHKATAKCTFEILTCHFGAFNVQLIRCDNRLMNFMQHQRWQSRGGSNTSIKLDMKIDR